MKLQLTAALLLTVSSASVLAVQPLQKPFRNPVARPVSASDARKDYEETLRKINGVRNPPAANQPTRPPAGELLECPALDGSVRQCVSREGMLYYVGDYLPFVTNSSALVPASPTSSTEGGAPEFGWVPVQKVIDGQAVLKNLEDLTAKQTLENCNEETAECKTVVEAVTPGERERVLAQCDVARVGDEAGAVRNCDAVAVITPEDSYLRAVVGYWPGRSGLTTRDEWDDTVEYQIVKGAEDASMPNLESVVNVVRDGFSAKLLGLKTAELPKDDAVRVVGVAGVRPSRLHRSNTSWEQLSLRADVIPNGGSGFIVKVYFVVLINQLEGSNPQDFRRPAKDEVEAYKADFAASVWLRLTHLCNRPLPRYLEKTVVCTGK